MRHFEIQYCSTDELSNHCGVDYSRADGKIVVMLCESERERAIAIQKAESDLKGKKSIICVIPRPLRVLGGLLQEVQRWDWVQANVPELANDNFAAEEVSRQLSTAADALQTRLKSLLSLQHFHSENGPTFFRDGAEIRISSGRKLLSYLSETCDELYRQSPSITNELINRRSLSSAAAAARGKLIQAIFTAAAKPYLGMEPERKPPEMSMYLSVLKAARLHRETKGGTWTLSIPRKNADPCRVLPALSEIQRLLDLSETKRLRVSTILESLREPPFGIRNGLGPLLLSIFAAINEQHVAFYDDGRFMRQVLGLDLMRLFKLPEQFEIQYCRMSGVRTSLFERLMSALELSATKHEKPNVLDIVRPLCVFAAQLPPYSQKTKTLSAAAIAVRTALLNASEPAVLLFRELPKACGFGDFIKDDRPRKEIDLFVEALRLSIAAATRALWSFLDEGQPE
ncbi:MAG: hypothetical protein WAN65_24185 [Candidatus Sulfotelmatobacter sp.]